MLGRISKLSGVHICALDYRLLQEAPFPAAFDDAREAWDHLVRRGYDPHDIILGGDSAGGGLMLALLSYLNMKGLSLQVPSQSRLGPILRCRGVIV